MSENCTRLSRSQMLTVRGSRPIPPVSWQGERGWQPLGDLNRCENGPFTSCERSVFPDY